MTSWAQALLARLRGLMARPGLAGKGPLLAIAGVLTLAAAVALGTGLAHAGANGTTLSATKTATAHWDKTFHWTIDKSVTPDNWSLFNGDSGTSDYTVAVTKDGGTDTYYVDGQICVTNGGGVATTGLQIVDNLTAPPSQAVINSVSVDVSAHPNLASGETECYAYTITIPNAVPGQTYKDTADITITNHSGANCIEIGQRCGPNPSATSPLPSSPHLIHDSITVNDTNGQSQSFGDSGSMTYSETFTCSAGAGKHDNTATITYNDDSAKGDSSSATVTVTCYALDPNKTANTSFTRTDLWTINKSVDQSSLTLALGQQFTVNYTVDVHTTGFSDSGWAVSGTITVHNNTPLDATLNGVSDAMTGGITATPDCGVSFPYTLAAGGSLPCTYSADLPDATSRTNTATVTQQNYHYDSGGNATPSGTTDTTGSAAVDFSSAVITYVDQTASVSDSYAGSLGTAHTGTNTFTYSRVVGPYNTCGDPTVDNKASFTTADTGTTGQSSATVNVHVPCASGCTLTIGYWKTHAGFTGKNADMVTPQLPIWLGTSGGTKSINVTSASQAVHILSIDGTYGPPSNGISKLYAQLLAAKLNIQSGASNSAVSGTIASADAFLATKNWNDWSGLSKSQQQTVLGWMTALDNYNNGLTGPGHCSQ